ncbi:hypothetical protein TRP8649_03596 [Pelagimonas phthalicica]|uniref:Uncharacterized protein n=1 Tax=Pelagimonas phthalicica TaxID=1037362 RepID=A0A238JHN3_9RHOB|nr:hypothetical protein CLV87_3593 [Pelagimonas phthalicica]SMX29462.1 hypothetical protein TRP8649_03596 [Pelagimonas phthalicica]
MRFAPPARAAGGAGALPLLLAGEQFTPGYFWPKETRNGRDLAFRIFRMRRNDLRFCSLFLSWWRGRSWGFGFF